MTDVYNSYRTLTPPALAAAADKYIAAAECQLTIQQSPRFQLKQTNKKHSAVLIYKQPVKSLVVDKVKI